MSIPPVPRFWAWLVGVAAPPQDRDALAGDLQERFAHRVERRGAGAARRWYRGQALRLVLVLALHRLLAAPRGLRFADEMRFSGLDIRLGLRMLVKHAGLSLVAVFGMAIAMTIGIISFEILSNLLDRSLPVEGGDRIDLEGPAKRIVVNRAFVDKFFGGRTAIGHRIRYSRVQRNLPPPEPRATWYEIVGVVSDFPAYPPSGLGDLTATVYHPLDPATVDRARISLRVAGGAAASSAHTVREVATNVDPTLKVDELRPLEDVYRDERFFVLLISRAFAVTTLSVLLLSGAGVFALMSFSVAQRSREIGIRAALGAGPRPILIAIFGRVTRQLGAGAAVGFVLGGGLLVGSGLDPAQTVVLLVASPLILLLTGFLAAVGPARRGLAIQPSEALRSE